MLKRFGVSLESGLLDKFDKLLEIKGYSNRSEGIRDLIRDAIVNKEWLDGKIETAGAVIIVYNHHQHELAQKVTDTQHKDHKSIVSTLHVHLDAHNCLEIIVLKGTAEKIQKLADMLISTKGVKFGRFIPATTGKSI
jgi:CopG family nickel-responsive transcriptional regulator